MEDSEGGSEMPTLELNFNFLEDDNLHFSGNVRFASDFAVSGNAISIRGLGEWRNVPEKTICVSKSFMDRVLTPRRLSNFEGSDLKVIGFKARHDILLGFKLRAKGQAAIKATLEKFFKTISSSAKVTIESLASDEDTNEGNHTA